MRILFLSVDYPELLVSIYGKDGRKVGDESYEVLLARRNASLFARLDYLTSELLTLGHEAYASYVNNLGARCDDPAFRGIFEDPEHNADCVC
jgi:hypothetical protein